jgi:hypothetical protein
VVDVGDVNSPEAGTCSKVHRYEKDPSYEQLMEEDIPKTMDFSRGWEVHRLRAPGKVTMNIRLTVSLSKCRYTGSATKGLTPKM